LAVDVIYAEYTLRRERDEPVSRDDYVQKYPHYARQLIRQFSIESGLNSLRLSGDDTVVEANPESYGNDSLEVDAAPAAPTSLAAANHLANAGEPESHARSSAEALATGRKIGRYLVIEELAATAKSLVYRVLHPELQSEFVLKLDASPTASDAERARLLREGRILASIDHPHVARVSDVGDLDGRTFIVCEYVRGRPLSQLVRESRLSIPAAVRLVAQVARAVAAVHRKGLLHLDVKPANVIVRESGEPCLIDFDLAAHRDELGAADMEAGSLRGTLLFMAPEQAAGANAGVDQRADLFSLGAVLYFALTGEPPYEQKSFSATLADVRAGAWRRDFLASPAVPRSLARLCEQTLLFEPQDRPTTAEEFAESLERWEASASRPRWRPLLLAGCLGAIALGGAIFSAASPFGPAPEEPLRSAAGKSATSGSETVAPLIRIPSELSIHAWSEGRAFDLEDVLPVRNGVPLSIRATRPAGVALALLLIDSTGEVRELARQAAEPSAGVLQYPEQTGQAAPLVGPSGTEIVLLIGRRGEPVNFADVKAACRPGEPWPALPNDTLAVAKDGRVSLHGTARGLGEPVSVASAESLLQWRLKTLIETLQLRYEVVEAIAFPHAAAASE
ncbi:MAG TPA: serine/threonine-protein kinase, partial [Pirellulales bacterium]